MKFIANLLISLSNITIPIAYIIMILGLVIAVIQGIGKIQQKKNDLIIKKITPLVEDIKQKYPKEEQQLEGLNQLYKQYHFSALRPVVIKVLGIILYSIVLLTVIYGKNFNIENCVYPIAFFSIKNIFERTIIIIIPILIIIFKMLSLYIFIPKELKNNKELLATFVIYVLTIGLCSIFFPPSYSLFFLGFEFGEFLIAIPLNKLRRKIYYQFPPVINKDNKENIDTPPKKSIKEIMADLEKDLKL